jgi:CubicO group peptidase (beta-lactamase class C family)
MPGMSNDLHQKLSELVEAKRVPGLAITVLKEGETLFSVGYGHADIENRIPVDPQNTIFRIASVSKPIASLALASLVAAGKMDLDESLYTYVPYFPKKKYDFTIRQLAGHTAGIRGYRGKEYAQNQPFSIREGLQLFQDDPLVFRPGKGYLYNSFDWVLISLAMEEVTGLPYWEYVQKSVLEPIGMTKTSQEVPGSLPSGSAVFYTRAGVGFRPAIQVDNRYKLAGGGYLSTAEDLGKLGRACLEHTLVPKGVMEEFLTAQEVGGKSTFYGLGWQVSRDLEGREFVGHVGNAVGGCSNFFIYPREEVVVSVLVNCTDPGIQPVLDNDIIPLVFAYPDKA